jgi:transposase
VIPDNAKNRVTKACRYDPDLNPTYQEMAMHYGVGVVPARPYKPRDKAKAESGVLLAERWIIAALRHRKFFSIEELNQAIRELRDRINQRPIPQTRRVASVRVRCHGQTGAESSSRRAL